jgi:hypothetical protein
MSPVKVLATLARVSLGRSGPSLTGFSSHDLMTNRAFAVFFMFLVRDIGEGIR